MTSNLWVVARVRELRDADPVLSTEISKTKVHVMPVGAGSSSGINLFFAGLRTVMTITRTIKSRGARDLRICILAFAPGPLAVAAAISGKLFRVPVVSYFGIDWEAEYWAQRVPRYLGGAGVYLRRQRNRCLQRFIAKSSSACLVAGKDLLSKISRTCPRTVETIPIVDIDIQSWPVQAVESVSAASPAAGHRCQPNCVRFLFVGTLTERKGINDMVDAFDMIRLRRPEFTLDIVGHGELEADLREHCDSTGIGGMVRMHGYVSDRKALAELYEESDVFVLPSYSEGFPRVLYEAMASGLPIIAYRVGGIPNVLTHLETAYLIDSGNMGALVGAIEWMADNPKQRREFANRNRELVQRLLRNDAAEQHAKIITSVVGAG